MFILCVQFIKLCKYRLFCIFLPISLVHLSLQLVLQSILGMIFFAATGSPLLFAYCRPNWWFLLLTFQSVLLMGRFLPWFYSIFNKIFYGSFWFFLNFFFNKISPMISFNLFASNETVSGKSDRGLISN